MQRIGITGMLTAGLILAAGCAKPDQGLMGYPKFRKTPGGKSTWDVPEGPPPRILPETHYAAGRVFEQQGAMDKAVEQYRKATAMNHNYTAAYQRMGLILSLTGQHEEALAAFEKAVELKPDSAVIRNNLGFELMYFERWAEAERHLREAARIDPQLPRSYMNLALLYSRTERFDDALASFRRVLPEPDAYYNLGLVLRAQKRKELAKDVFRHVLKLNPKFTAARRQLAAMEARDAEVQVLPAPDAPRLTAATADPITEEPANDPAGGTIDKTTAAAATAEKPDSRPEKPVDEPNAERIGEAIALHQSGAPAADSDPGRSEPRRPMSAGDDGRLTMADIASALEGMENDRRGADGQELPVPNIFSPPTILDEPTNYTPAIDPMSAIMTYAGGEPDEFVLVLAAAETSEAIDESAGSADDAETAIDENSETWKLLRELESSIQIIRNEIECRKGESAEADEAGESGLGLCLPGASPADAEDLEAYYTYLRGSDR